MTQDCPRKRQTRREGFDLRIGGARRGTARYAIAVDDWIAGGADGFTWFKGARRKRARRRCSTRLPRAFRAPAATRAPEKRVTVVTVAESTMDYGCGSAT